MSPRSARRPARSAARKSAPKRAPAKPAPKSAPGSTRKPAAKLAAVALAKSAGYAAQARALKAMGYKISFGKRGGHLPQRKAAITRRVKKLASFLSPKNRFVFLPATKAQGRKAAGPGHRTPRGIFVQRPANVPLSKFRAMITRGGALKTSARGKGGRYRQDVIIKLDPARLARDPSAAITAAMRGQKKPAHYVVMVNGHTGKATYTAKDFHRYLAEQLIPRLLHRSKKGHAMTAVEVADFFQVKLVYGARP